MLTLIPQYVMEGFFVPKPCDDGVVIYIWPRWSLSRTKLTRCLAIVCLVNIGTWYALTLKFPSLHWFNKFYMRRWERWRRRCRVGTFGWWKIYIRCINCRWNSQQLPAATVSEGFSMETKAWYQRRSSNKKIANGNESVYSELGTGSVV